MHPHFFDLPRGLDDDLRATPKRRGETPQRLELIPPAYPAVNALLRHPPPGPKPAVQKAKARKGGFNLRKLLPRRGGMMPA